MTSTMIATDRQHEFALGTEQRFPLALESTLPAIWDAYERSLVDVWDPEAAVHWDRLDVAAWDADQRAAGALVWSHLAWVEFPAIAESEATLVRACLDLGVDIDIKYCLSMRAVERARSTDYGHLLASRLDHYESGSDDSVLAGLLDDDLARRVLHVDTDLDAYLAAHVLAQAIVDLRMWEATGRQAVAPIANVVELIVRDKARMVDVAELHLAHTLPSRDQADRVMIAGVVEHVMNNEEAAGRRVPALLSDGPLRDRLLAAHGIASSAGLGGVTDDAQSSIFRDASGEVTQRLAAIGVDVSIG
ncbi:MAG: hypothetical protein R8G01_01780 [Ilumatobacteraceae bacterium]|uniref:hypothetical protein n=1 Tax=Ilumatobacter fluminis TaxID=467091 RepID=UPI0029696182|nr:hypothetical protein [Ilumatobacteraceae bacterium]